MATVMQKGRLIQDPPFIVTVFNSPRLAWFWLLVRVWRGYQWIDASLHKINNPAWTQTGEALKGYWTGAVQIPAEGRPPISFTFYRSFIQYMLDAQGYVWFAKVVSYGELLVGIALILGACTRTAFLFGGGFISRVGQHPPGCSGPLPRSTQPLPLSWRPIRPPRPIGPTPLWLQ